MQTPIFIYVENSYLEIYCDIRSAEISLEAIDVEDDLFKGFDAKGHLLNIEPYNGVAKITLAEENPTHQNELVKYIQEFLAYCYPDIEIKDDADLISLLKKLLDRSIMDFRKK